MGESSEEVRELRRRALSRLGVPAKLLLILAILGVVLGAFIALEGGLELTGPRPRAGLGSLPHVWLVGVFAVLWSGFIGYGAWEMDRLGNYRIARLAAWIALIPVPVPAWLLWFVGAVLAVRALADPAVRAAFSTGNAGALEAYMAARRYPPPRRPKAGRGEPGHMGAARDGEGIGMPAVPLAEPVDDESEKSE